MEKFSETMGAAVDDFCEAHMRPLRLLANVGDYLNNRITAEQFHERNDALVAEADAAEKRRAERAAKAAEGSCP